MERGQIESLKRRLRSANPEVMNEIAEQIRRKGASCPPELLASFIERLQHTKPYGNNLASLVIALKNRELYEASGLRYCGS